MIQNFNYRLAEVGKIKIGTKGSERTSKKGGKYRIPTKLEYFSITTLERGKDDILIPDVQVMEKLGSEPKQLDIMLLYDDVDLNFQTCFAYYSGKKCVCRGDGKLAERTLKDGAIESVDCNPKICPYYAKNTCKISGILSCVLPSANQVGGVYKFRTHGYNSVSNILSGLKFLFGLTNGVLASVKLKLTLSPKTVDIPTGGTSIIYAANVIYEGTIESLLNHALKIAEHRIKNKINMEALEYNAKKSILLKDNDSPADVEEEFYTDEQKIKDEINNIRNNFQEIIETKFDKLSAKSKAVLTGELVSKIKIKLQNNLPVWNTIIDDIAMMQTATEIIKNFIPIETPTPEEKTVEQPEIEKDIEVEVAVVDAELDEKVLDEENELLAMFNFADMKIKNLGGLAELDKFKATFKKKNKITTMLRQSGVKTLKLYLTELEKEFDCLK